MYLGQELVISKAGKHGSTSFDELFSALERREEERREMRRYINGIKDSVDRETALWMHIDGINEQATDEDILATLEIF